MKRIITLSISLMTLSFASIAQDGWESLFNGKDFTGWEQLNGKAKYHVEGDQIVGVSILNTPKQFYVHQGKIWELCF